MHSYGCGQGYGQVNLDIPESDFIIFEYGYDAAFLYIGRPPWKHQIDSVISGILTVWFLSFASIILSFNQIV